jgi:YihY family inner membrane protein
MQLVRRPITVGWDSMRLFMRAQGLSWGGAVGLYLFLSVPPLMVASAMIAEVVVARFQAEDFVVEQAAKFVPAQSELLSGVFAGNPGATLVTAVVSIGFLLFSGSRAFAALASAINVMWRQSEEVDFWDTQRLRAILLGGSLALLALAALGEAAIAVVTDGSSSSEQSWLLDWQVLPTVLLALFLLLAYKVLPMDDVPWSAAAIGTVVGTVGIRVSQAVMGLMSEAGTFRTPYGDLAGVALMATWALVVGIAVLGGATVVAVLCGRFEEITGEGPNPAEG